MLWANVDGKRSLARPNGKGECPYCHLSMTPKCGEIVSWHWAHKGETCDPWYEPESEWHRQWKAQFPPEWQEVVVGKHIADVKTPFLTVEFQASLIAPAAIIEREAHYGHMVWVLRGDDFYENFCIREHLEYQTFRWKWPRQSWWYAEKPIYIDFGSGSMFRIKKMHQEVPCGGWGNWVEQDDFVTWCSNGRHPNDARRGRVNA